MIFYLTCKYLAEFYKSFFGTKPIVLFSWFFMQGWQNNTPCFYFNFQGVIIQVLHSNVVMHHAESNRHDKRNFIFGTALHSFPIQKAHFFTKTSILTPKIQPNDVNIFVPHFITWFLIHISSQKILKYFKLFMCRIFNWFFLWTSIKCDPHSEFLRI